MLSTTNNIIQQPVKMNTVMEPMGMAKAPATTAVAIAMQRQGRNIYHGSRAIFVQMMNGRLIIGAAILCVLSLLAQFRYDNTIWTLSTAKSVSKNDVTTTITSEDTDAIEIAADETKHSDLSTFRIVPLSSNCTNHIPMPNTINYRKYSSPFTRSCKFLPEPTTVASRCETDKVQQLIEIFPKERQNIQRYVMFLATGHSGHSLVGSLFDAHPMMLVANERDIFSRWVKEWRQSENRFERSQEHIFQNIFNNSLSCALYTRWQHDYNYTVPNGWGGSWIPGELTVIGDKKGGSTMKIFQKLQTQGRLLETFHDFQTKALDGLPILILHVYWGESKAQRQVQNLLHTLRSAKPPLKANFKSFNWNSTLYSCGTTKERLQLLEDVCNFLGVPCDSTILNLWESMAVCKSASKHIQT
jgi:hypothetical protein